MFDTNPYWHIMVKEEAFPLQIYDFEDVKMPLPACEDKKLRKMYGNYMELPPVEKRKITIHINLNSMIKRFE